MRLSILAVPFLLMSAPAWSADPRPAGNMPVVTPGGPVNAKCPPISPYHAMKDRRPLTDKKLNELPPGVHYKAAYRRIDGCEAPIVAGYGIGATRTTPRR